MLPSTLFFRDRSEFAVDPLSDVLSLIDPRSYAAAGFDLGGDWSIQFPPHNGIKCYALVCGQCWLRVEGVPEPLLASAGDCLLLTQGRAFRIASDLDLVPMDAERFYGATPVGGVTTYQGGETFGIAGHFEVSGRSSDVLLGLLPPIVHLRTESDKANMRASIERMRQELRNPQPGGTLLLRQLALMMLVQALRLHLADGPSGAVGWLFALSDKRLSAALTAMHAAPARRWSLASLAQAAGMSRTSFAVQFKATVGESPIDYLTRWRMLRAGDRLENSNDSIADIAQSLGYSSGAAFSSAFKRVMGCSPRQYGTRESTTNA
jgi:AraC-like DNA-binding protein